MFVGIGEIYTQTSELVSKVNFVISEIGMKNSLFFSRLLIHAFQREMLCILHPWFFFPFAVACSRISEQPE